LGEGGAVSEHVVGAQEFGEELAAAGAQVPAAGVGDFPEQDPDVEAFEKAADGGAVAAWGERAARRSALRKPFRR
jgi:hypothetical protein